MPQAPRPKSSFDDELHACQRELADLINHLFAIVANTGTARMAWSPRQYWRQVVQKHRVAVRGWPKAIPFCSPMQISSLNLIGRLRRGWQTGGEGGIRFRRLTDEEFEEARMELEPPLDAEAQKRREMRKQREDRHKKRQLRPIATRGIHRRAKGGIKSNEFVDGSDVDELK